MVTHEPEDERYVDRVVWLKDGLVEKVDAYNTGAANKQPLQLDLLNT